MDQTTAISRAAANAPVTQAELAAAFMPAAAEAVRQSPDLAGAPVHGGPAQRPPLAETPRGASSRVVPGA